MELKMSPASSSPPPKGFGLDSAAASPYVTAPSSPRGRLVPSEGAAGGLFLTAPPSPSPFDLLPPATPPRLAGANPFDLFQHFTSAPASPRRAAAVYAHVAEGSGSDGDQEFQPRRRLYATGGSSVPFDWEERPGTPKRGLGGCVPAADVAAWDTEFEFGTPVGKAAPAETLSTADELFEKGKIRPLRPRPKKTADDEPKIRPLKPPPGLLDGGGSVTPSPRSPMVARGAGAVMWSPRRRSRVGSGVDFDPFTAALLEATKAPSPLGGKDDKGGGVAVAPGSPPTKPATRPASRSAGSWRRWRLSDLLLFRSSSDGGRVNKHGTDAKPVQQLDVPVRKASAQPAVTTIKASAAKGDDMGKGWKHGDGDAAAAADSVAGCARLSPLQRLAKGLGAYSWHHRGMAAPATKG